MFRGPETGLVPRPVPLSARPVTRDTPVTSSVHLFPSVGYSGHIVRTTSRIDQRVSREPPRNAVQHSASQSPRNAELEIPR